MTLRALHAFATLAICMCGCAIFSTAREDLLAPQKPLSNDQIAEFNEDQPPTRNVVRLNTSIVSTVASDQRIRTLVWEELDESGLMSPDNRRRLNQSGLRVGVAGGTLPWALESLAREEHSSASQQSQRHTIDPAITQKSFLGTQVAIAEGSSSHIEFPAPDGKLVIPAGQIAGLKNGAVLHNARCIFEITPLEFGNGWVVIRVVPQIHHGALTTRYDLGNENQRMPLRQKVRPLYEQQFELKLHVNETVVVGHLDQEEWTVGRMLFQADSLTSRSEKLIALQLNDLEKVAGQKSLQVTYKRY